jgi:hypothetical protein
MVIESKKNPSKEPYAEKSSGLEAEALITELVEIGLTCGFISNPAGDFDENGYHRRTREIGEKLDKIGGMGIMQQPITEFWFTWVQTIADHWKLHGGTLATGGPRY